MRFLKLPGSPAWYVAAAGVIGAALVALGFLLPDESARLATATGQVAGGVITILTVLAGAVARWKNNNK